MNIIRPVRRLFCR